MNVVFFGSGPFALPVLERLQEHSPRHALLRVVTRPDRPQKRGRHLEPTPVRARALQLGIPCDAPATANDPAYIEALARLQPDLAVVADYGEMIRKQLRELPRIGIFNLHASLLPRHRGASPVAHAILAGDRETGVSLFRIEKGLDSGPVVDAIACAVGELETAGELEGRLSRLAADLIEKNLEAFAEGAFREEPQVEALATFAPKLEKDAGAIDWNVPASKVVNLVHAMNPWPGAFTFLHASGGAPERTIILRTRLAAPVPSPSRPGTIEVLGKAAILVHCERSAVEIIELKREGKAALAAPAFLRGKQLRPGDRFGPQEEAA